MYRVLTLAIVLLVAEEPREQRPLAPGGGGSEAARAQETLRQAFAELGVAE